MHIYQQAAVASALVALAAASPVELEPRGMKFTVPQSVPKPGILKGPVAVLKTYGKYNKEAPDDVKAAAAANTGTVAANPEVCIVLKPKSVLCSARMQSVL